MAIVVLVGALLPGGGGGGATASGGEPPAKDEAGLMDGLGINLKLSRLREYLIKQKILPEKNGLGTNLKL